MRSVFFPHLVNGPFGDPALYVRLAHRREALLFDCGDLHPLSPRDILKVRAIFLSHAHIDHLAGFTGLLRTFLYQDSRLDIYGPPGIIDRFRAQLGGYTWNLLERYTLVLAVHEGDAAAGRRAVFRAGAAFRPDPVEPWSCPGGLLHTTGHWQVRAVPLDHGGIVSLAFCLQEPLHIAIHKDALERRGYRPGPWLTRLKDLLRQDAPGSTPFAVPLENGQEVELSLAELAADITHSERGMKLVYVTDAAPAPANLERIAELAADAHLLAIEAPFSHDDLARARERNHLTARIAGEIGRQARVGRLLLFHHSPRYLETPERLAAEAQAAFRGGASTP
jgi:ribonuclease Z